ncbi:MAG: DUF6106 family protein [Oscillospiraceae bacterium]
MGDTFLEQIVKKRDSLKETIIKFLIMLAGALIFIISLAFLGNQFVGPFSLLIGAGGIYFAWYFASGLNLEFEYIYTNGEIDFDKISAKRKRKRIITVRISSFDDFAKFDIQKYKNQKYDVTINASASLDDPQTHYATFRNRDGKNCIIMFTPNEKLLETINSQFRKKAYGR